MFPTRKIKILSWVLFVFAIAVVIYGIRIGAWDDRCLRDICKE